MEVKRNAIVRKEQCVSCISGEVTFRDFLIDNKKQVLGTCDRCGYCCDNKQDRPKYSKESLEVYKELYGN